MSGSHDQAPFHGTVAIVTGGASGIGRALAETLAAQGCAVVLADLQNELAEEVAVALRRQGFTATAARLDVTKFPDVQRLVRDTTERHGRLDYLFNNAGIGMLGEVRDHRIEDWDRIVDVNLRGVIHGIAAAYPTFLAQGFGHIINTASTQGLIPTPLMASYGMTKHAVVALSRSLRIEAAAAGIRVSVLCPGVIRTPLLEGGRYGAVLLPTSKDQLRAYFERARPMDPIACARRVLSQVSRNKAIIIVPSWYRVMWWIDRFSPRLGMALAQILFEFSKRTLSDRQQLSGHSH